MRAPSCCHGRVRVTAVALTALTAALLVVLLLVPAVEAQLLHEKGPGYGRTLRPALPVTGASPPAWSVGNPRCSAGAVDGFTTSHAWMSRLPDETKIFLDLSIPGTHGSVSYVFKDGSSFQSQSNTITQQLEAGIRFLDMPLAFIRSTMYVAYHMQPVVSEAVTFQHAMQQVTSFLDKNPREVVLIRVGRTDVAMNFPQYKWSDDLAISEFNRHVPLSKYRDRACTQQNCKLGPSRGRIIFIDHQLRVRKLTLLRYEDVMMIQWHNTVLETRPQLDERWHQLRSALELASMTRTPLAGTPESRAGMITFFSAFRTGGHGKDPHPIPPFFAASGQVHHGEDERRRLVEVAEKFGTDRHCQAPIGSPPYPDFPRVDCKGCGKETMCEIAFEGMNRLLYTWLRRGLTGQQQSCHLQSKNVYPRYLGILALDFPDNALIDIIVSLNFLHPDRYKEPAFKTQSRGVRPFACTQNYCAASGALSADAYVQTVNRGRIVAGKVVEGDELHAGLLEADAGAEGAPPKTCRVIAVNTEGNRFDPTTTLNGVVGSALVTATRNSASRMSPPGNLHLMGSGPWMSPAWPGFFDSIAAPAGVLMEGETSSRIVVVEHGRVVNHMPREQVSVQKPQKLVTIVTECGAIAGPVSGNTKDVSSTGGVTPFPALLWRLPFTSVPSEKEPVMTGAEYNRVYAAVLRVVKRTGTFWFDPRTYVEANTCAAFRGDPGVDVVGGEGVRLWSSKVTGVLPKLSQMLSVCLAEHAAGMAETTGSAALPASCKSLEVEAAQWIRAHVDRRKHASVLGEAYPHMGDPEAEAGNLLFDILHRDGGKPDPDSSDGGSSSSSDTHASSSSNTHASSSSNTHASSSSDTHASSSSNTHASSSSNTYASSSSNTHASSTSNTQASSISNTHASSSSNTHASSSSNTHTSSSSNTQASSISNTHASSSSNTHASSSGNTHASSSSNTYASSSSEVDSSPNTSTSELWRKLYRACTPKKTSSHRHLLAAILGAVTFVLLFSLVVVAVAI